MKNLTPESEESIPNIKTKRLMKILGLEGLFAESDDYLYIIESELEDEKEPNWDRINKIIDKAVVEYQKLYEHQEYIEDQEQPISENLRYYKPEEARRILSLSFDEMMELIKKGDIPFTRISSNIFRINKEDFEEWLDKNTNHPVRNKVFDCEDASYITLKEFDEKYLKGGKSTMAKEGQRYWTYKFGGIFCRKNKKGYLKWFMQFKDVDGKWRQRAIQNAQTRKDAVEVLQQKYKEVFEVKHGLRPKVKRITFIDFAKKYLEDYAKVNKKSWKTDLGVLESMKKFFGSKYLENITSEDVERYKKRRVREVKKVTVNYDLAVLKKMLNLALEWEYLDSKKMAKIRMFPRVQSQKERILNPKEEKELLKHCPEHLRQIIKVALNTGLRLGEILNLKWNDIEKEKSYLIVEKSKSGRSRTVPLNDKVCKLFQSLPEKNTYIFYNPRTGTRYDNVSSSFSTARRKSGLEDLRFHDLRHTFASRLIEKGVDIITVKELLGHSDVGITQRYTHSRDETKQRAVRTLISKDLL